MTREKRSARLRPMALCAFACAVVLAGAHIQATTWLVKFAIGPTPGVTPWGVFSDAFDPATGEIATGTDEYQDWRLTEPGSDLDFCTQASPFSSGDLFIRLNRNLDGEGGSQRCSPLGTGIRQFHLVINHAGACAELASGGYPDLNPNDEYCTINGGWNPRIGVGNLWARNPKFPINFLTFAPNPGHPISYEIRSDANAVISSVAGNPDSKVATYTGTAKLVKFGDGKTRTLSHTFALPFSISFTRYAQ